MTNLFCDFVSIDQAYSLMKKLQLNVTSFSELCGVSRQQFYNWDKKGRMPEYRLSQIKLALHKTFKDEYDRKCKILEEI